MDQAAGAGRGSAATAVPTEKKTNNVRLRGSVSNPHSTNERLLGRGAPISVLTTLRTSENTPATCDAGAMCIDWHIGEGIPNGKG
jgi:hypothetical protein